VDDTELSIQRKARQTEGLGLWADPNSDGTVTIRERNDAGEYVWSRFTPDGQYVGRGDQTSHPDSVAGQSQAGLILRHLQSGGTLTALDALDLFGCNRLAARIADLRAKGYRVQSTLIELPNGKRVASYALLDTEDYYTERKGAV
jgi:hypothetical protein